MLNVMIKCQDGVQANGVWSPISLLTLHGVEPCITTMGTWNQVPCDPKMQPVCKLGVLVYCFAWTCESSTIPTDM